jgi:hypothetical protein
VIARASKYSLLNLIDVRFLEEVVGQSFFLDGEVSDKLLS